MNNRLDVHDMNALKARFATKASDGWSTKSRDLQEAQIVLGLLESVERDGGQSQRRLAAELGIALGLVNAYLKRCIKKGLVKVSEAPARRYAYYLTPHGFAEKSRLTVEYLSYSFSFFRQAKTDCAACSTRRASAGISSAWSSRASPISPRSPRSARWRAASKIVRGGRRQSDRRDLRRRSGRSPPSMRSARKSTRSSSPTSRPGRDDRSRIASLRRRPRAGADIARVRVGAKREATA